MTKKSIYIVEYYDGDTVRSDYFIYEANASTSELWEKARKVVEDNNDDWEDFQGKDIEDVYPIDDSFVKEVYKTI